MADKRISQLVERTDIANNDVVPIVASGATTTNKATISSIQEFMQENLDLGVTSVGITLGTTGTDVSVTGSPITTSGNITINLPTASATNRGLLSSADWTTFNNKQAAGNYVTLDTAQTITAQKTFSTSGGSDTAIINHGSGSGIALNITKGGNGEGLRVAKTSGSGNAVTITGGDFEAGVAKFGGTVRPTTNMIADLGSGSIRWSTLFGRNINLTEGAIIGGTFEAPTIVRTGGTSSQFLKADGSVDSSTYLTTGTAASTYITIATPTTITGVKTFASLTLNLAAAGTSNATIFSNSSADQTSMAGVNFFGFNSNNNIYFNKGTTLNAGFLVFNNTAARTYTLPDATGTLALTSNLSAYLPLTGGTLTGGLNGTSASFSSDVQTSTRLIAAKPAGEIRITPDLSGTTNRIESLGSLPFSLTSVGAITLAAGGTTPQITLGNTGAVTLTGSLTGTTANLNPTGGNSGLNITASGSAPSIELRGNTDNITAINFYNNAGTTLRNYIISTETGFNLSSQGNTPLTFSTNAGGGGSPRMTISGSGEVTLTGALNGTSASFTAEINPIILRSTNAFTMWTEYYYNTSTLSGYIGSGAGILSGANASDFIVRSEADFVVATGGNNRRLTLASTGAATFSSSVTAKSPAPNANSLEVKYSGNSNNMLQLLELSTGTNVEFNLRNSSGTAITRFNTSGDSFINGGNVGIGTPSPVTALHVEKSNPTRGIIATIKNSASSGQTGSQVHFVQDSIADWVIGQPAGTDAFAFWNNRFPSGDGTERMRITSDGFARLSASSGGIQFNGDTAAANALDDYEEGTWTPTYTGTNITVTSYGSQGGYYTKVGRLVTVTFRIMTEAVTVIGSENIFISGLPFAAANVTENSNAVNIFDNSRWVGTPPVSGQINANQSTIVLHSNIGNTGAGQDPTNALSSNMATGAGNRNMVRATATYFTA